ncbi:DNA damage-binding protein 1a [Striga hermonthica]|uniref:DNA damage-binding protein 1 n=1 Tax=Striga hermonthica TaxID=68872 RepID=A0A9N7MAR5_STRHE|nr:DNA damage-binding protein 1a [Striga hermonthica]
MSSFGDPHGGDFPNSGTGMRGQDPMGNSPLTSLVGSKLLLPPCLRLCSVPISRLRPSPARLHRNFQILNPRKRNKRKMSLWNYVATAHKPTRVTHTCVGNFTAPDELNLIVVKCTRVEINSLMPSHRLHPILDVPIYGRIAALQFFRPHGETRDLLFMATEKYEFCVLQWDAEKAEFITRARGNVSNAIGRPTDNGQIGIVDPDCRLIGLHLYDGLFTVIPFHNQGQLMQAFDIRLEELQVLDIKFLYGCPKPTIAVLYQDNKGARRMKTYEVDLENKVLVQGRWSHKYHVNGAELLIPVPLPLCGVLIVSCETILYCSASALKEISFGPSITRAYGRVDADGSRYLLGDCNGLLHLLVITHEMEIVTGLQIKLLGETSIASSISYLKDDVIFVGSSYGDSQLLKLNLQPEAEGYCVEVLEIYVNLGPIVDFCVVNLEKQGQCQVVTCSGAYKHGSVRIVCNGIGINEQASVKLEGIKGMWSLGSATHDPYDTFLVISFVGETRILALNMVDELEETEIEGFRTDVQTLFSHDSVYDQLVQVLLSTGGGHLVYLEIGDGVLTECSRIQLENDISCLDINPIGDDPNRSQLAVVGIWGDISVMIYSLPELKLMLREHLEGGIVPRSVLLCSFEGTSYLLCALGDGHLLSFVLNTRNGQLEELKKVPLGMQLCTLGTFSSKNAKYVFVASDIPTAIVGIDKKLQYRNINLTGVSYMCSFHSRTFPFCLAIAKQDNLVIGTIDDVEKLHSHSIPLGEHARRICHQETTKTFAICSVKYMQYSVEDAEMHFVRLLDDRTFDFISIYGLDQFEKCCSILSCSFSNDNNAYYCIGTAYVLPEENEPTKGRILVFVVVDRKLQRIAEKETGGAVHSLNAFNGKLLATINQKIQLYKWMLCDDGSGDLQYECGHHGHVLSLFVQTMGDFIVVGDLMRSISLLTYKEGATEELARDYANNWMSAVEILDNDTYLGAENNYNLCTARMNSAVEEQGQLEIVGKYHLGDCINRFHHGSLIMRLPDSDVPQIPTIIFGTISGAIGVVASLPHEHYIFLQHLQQNLRRVVKGVGGLDHEKWRSQAGTHGFLDGDFIELFLKLNRNEMEEVSGFMGVAVEELVKRVQQLTRLH